MRLRMVVACAALVLACKACAGANVDVRAFGARGDGAAKDTRAIEAAVGAAVAGGGGEVVVPAGRYICGTIHLKSNVTLRLAPGAVLVLSPDDGDFDARETLPYKTYDDPDTTFTHHSLLAADGAENVSILGPGSIDGNRGKRGGPKPIGFRGCRHVTIRDLSIKDSPSYAVSLIGCEDVLVDGVRVVNSWADGIDPDCCRDVRISNCSIDSADDSICLKSSGTLGKPAPTEFVTVSNCVLASDCNCFKTGTESRGGFRNIVVANCAMACRKAETDGSGIAIETVDGGAVDGVSVTNVTMRGLLSPIFVRLGARCRGMDVKAAGTLQNVSIANVLATGSTLPSMILGIPGHLVRGLMLSNVRCTMAGGLARAPLKKVPENVDGYPDADRFGVPPAFGLYVRHADDVVLRDILTRCTKRDVRAAMVFADVRDVRGAPTGSIVR